MSTSNKEVTHNVTIPNSSPIILYSPPTTLQSEVENGWKSEFSLGESSVLGFTSVGRGSSHRGTQLDGASATFIFNGTALTIQGQATLGMQYDVTLDGQLVNSSVTPSTDHALASLSGLARNIEHNVTITARPKASLAQLNVESFIFTSNSGLIGASVLYQTLQDFDPAIQYSTGFDVRPESRLPDITSIHESNAAGSWAFLEFKGGAISVLGLTDRKNGNYSVNLDGTTTVYSSFSRILIPTVLYHHDNLDTRMTHRINVTALDDNPLQFRGFRVLNLEGGVPFVLPEPVPSSNLPLIIGVAVGGVFLIFGLAALVFFWFRRRRNVDDSLKFVQANPSSMEEKLIGTQLGQESQADMANNTHLSADPSTVSKHNRRSTGSWNIPEGTKFIHLSSSVDTAQVGKVSPAAFRFKSAAASPASAPTPSFLPLTSSPTETDEGRSITSQPTIHSSSESPDHLLIRNTSPTASSSLLPKNSASVRSIASVLPPRRTPSTSHSVSTPSARTDSPSSAINSPFYNQWPMPPLQQQHTPKASEDSSRQSLTNDRKMDLLRALAGDPPPVLESGSVTQSGETGEIRAPPTAFYGR